jgi:hypothetical protein
MDPSSLVSLSKVAGLGGIPLGVVVVVLLVPALSRPRFWHWHAGHHRWLVSGLAGGGNVTMTAGQGGWQLSSRSYNRTGCRSQ